MSFLRCPLCPIGVSQWMIDSGKAILVGADWVHSSCIIDYELKTGLNFKEVHQNTRPKVQADWSVSKYES